MTADPRAATNPMFGGNKLKLGIFSANCDGGLTMSLAPDRWQANWDDIAAMCRIADDAGLEFILPVAKWRGYQGKANIYGKSFETLTHSAAIGALTKRICVFSTVHVPLVTPAFAAKAPPAVLAQENRRVADFGASLEKIRDQLQRLG